MKYGYQITANCDSDSIELFCSPSYDSNIIIYDGMFLDMIKHLIPFVKWEFDDGDDVAHTDYIQYVAYTEPNDKTHYILASWCAYDDETGCRII